MLLISKSQRALETAIEETKSLKGLSGIKDSNCVLDYSDEEFHMLGDDCDASEERIDIGSGATKNAVKEMVGRYASSVTSAHIGCVDFGLNTITALETEGIEGIRFYFGEHNLTTGGNDLTVIMVAIGQGGVELIPSGLPFDEIAKEVGHGSTIAQIAAGVQFQIGK